MYDQPASIIIGNPRLTHLPTFAIVMADSDTHRMGTPNEMLQIHVGESQIMRSVMEME